MSNWSIEHHAKAATDAVEKLATLCRESQAAMTPGKAEPLAAYESRNLRTVRYYGTPDKAQAAFAAAKALDVKTREQNARAIASNAALFETLKRIITSAGIDPVDAVAKKRGVGWDYQPAAWVGSIGKRLPVSDGWSAVERSYTDADSAIHKWRQEIAEEASAAERDAKAEASKRESDRLIVVMATKYGLDAIRTRWNDVLDAILSRNKYLRLAHFLCKNRGDWNDGPSYARDGLDGFKVETAVDNFIAEEIGGLISEWGGDGRVFRDCGWSYDRLFALAQSQDDNLVADYQLASVNVDTD